MSHSPFIYGPLGATDLVPGGITLPGSTSGALTIKPANTTTTHTETWPAANAVGILTNDGAGTLTWATAPSGSNLNNYPNSLLNSAFDITQRGTANLVGSGGGASYCLDRWYADCTAGSPGIVQISQSSGAAVPGSKFAVQSSYTNAPTTGSADGSNIYQVLENADSLAYYNGVGSFGCLLKATGNVTQVGIQLMYATTEVKLTTGIGSQVLVTVNTSSFTVASIINQTIGTAMTTSGVIGIKILATAVSSGDLTDVGNGFVMQNPVLTPTATVQTYRKAGNTYQEELAMCQRFYTTVTSADNLNGRFGFASVVGTNSARLDWQYPVVLRAAPILGSTVTSGFQLSVASANYGLSSINDNGTGTRYIGTIALTTSTSGMTAGFVGELTANGVTTAAVTADAEI